MKISQLLVGLCLLSTSCVARMSQEDIQKEVDGFKIIQTRVQQTLQPIQDEINAVKTNLRPAFETEAAPIKAQMGAVDEEIRALEKQCDGLDQKLRAESAELEQQKQDEIQKTISPLQEALDKSREPIMARVQALEAEERKIYNDYYKLKADPKWGKWCGGMESLDVAWKAAIPREEIKKLYKSVENDLPQRIEAAERAIGLKYREEYLKREEACNRAREKVYAVIREKETHRDELRKQTYAIDQRHRAAINEEAIPDLAIVSRLAREVEFRMVSGLPV
ncbi:hypothetical protein [Candidatus Finniella inopinata]|uniref:Uncharacterized protein n=1 Tax=Candidatus Finniella inopinata TaxID=1696036 RepID=A0A4Q7DJ85_9PROT|nr:hypothetical protein [Candidatus Finniella inopinata]RZI46913.1 hypothetical protein EQU50_01425 [Candidatus Finniella inopinata]